MPGHSISAGTDDWIITLDDLNRHTATQAGCSAAACQFVLITILQTRGSAPREAGTKMLVLADKYVGTIGGGHLESKVIDESRALLDSQASSATPGANSKILRIALGASLGQCCGGHVVIMLECLSLSQVPWLETAMQYRKDATPALMVTTAATTDANSQSDAAAAGFCSSKLLVAATHSVGTLGCPAQDRAAIIAARAMLDGNGASVCCWQDGLFFDPVDAEYSQVFLFGAGHVGQAVIRVLQSLPYRIHWIDSREELFSNVPDGSNVRVLVSDEPSAEVDCAPANSYLLVMTHSHQLDLAICERALKRSDIAFCGLIGSATKRARFLQRLQARGLAPQALDRLTCPIGIQGVSGKHPAQIAIAVAAQLLLISESQIGNIPRVPVPRRQALAPVQARP